MTRLETRPRPRYWKYSDSEITHVCEKLQFVLEAAPPDVGQMVEDMIDAILEQLPAEQ